MIPKPDPVTLANVCNGAAAELFEREFQAAIENAYDPNTPARAKRVVTLKFTIVPTEQRDACSVYLEAASKLTPPKEAGEIVFMGRFGGKVVASPNTARQQELAFEKENAPRAVGDDPVPGSEAEAASA